MLIPFNGVEGVIMALVKATHPHTDSELKNETSGGHQANYHERYNKIMEILFGKNFTKAVKPSAYFSVEELSWLSRHKERGETMMAGIKQVFEKRFPIQRTSKQAIPSVDLDQLRAEIDSHLDTVTKKTISDSASLTIRRHKDDFSNNIPESNEDIKSSPYFSEEQKELLIQERSEIFNVLQKAGWPI